ncbi:MAG: hypothetical protein ACRCXZ_09280 [Patescibacteria group bacterium]
MNIQILEQKAEINISQILNQSILAYESEKVLIVYDQENLLSRVLLKAYKSNLPNAHLIEFNVDIKDELIKEFSELKPKDLVIMIQSSNFRLNDFRIRLFLFERGIKVIEHMHLYRNSEDQYLTYINSLEYEKEYYSTTSKFIHDSLVEAESLSFKGEGNTLEVYGPLEVPKLNIGDYTNMKNIGGTYPIGEVFTEVVDFASMNGSALIYAYANRSFDISFVDPFWIRIEKGLVVELDPKAPSEFVEIIKMVSEYETPLIREIGFGLNQAISLSQPLGDITAFERIKGIHLSLGHKHSVYKKPGIASHKAKFHIDLFLVVDEVKSDQKSIFKAGEYQSSNLNLK